jgi:hypothetical protein
MPTLTLRPTDTRWPTRTLRPTDTRWPTKTRTPTRGPSPTPVTLTVYFTDLNALAGGVPPFETAVTRRVTNPTSAVNAVLAEFFRGPTEAEKARGLGLVASGFTGVRQVRVEGGVAHVYLTGACNSNGAVYTVAQPILKNLLQFPEIQYVKIYDQDGQTGDPAGLTNSIPACLEP